MFENFSKVNKTTPYLKYFTLKNIIEQWTIKPLMSFKLIFRYQKTNERIKIKYTIQKKRNIELKLLAKIIYSSSMHTIFLFRVFSFIFFYFICFPLKLKFNFILLEHWTTNQFSICLFSNVRHISNVFAMSFSNGMWVLQSSKC